MWLETSCKGCPSLSTCVGGGRALYTKLLFTPCLATTLLPTPGLHTMPCPWPPSTHPLPHPTHRPCHRTTPFTQTSFHCPRLPPTIHPPRTHTLTPHLSEQSCFAWVYQVQCRGAWVFLHVPPALPHHAACIQPLSRLSTSLLPCFVPPSPLLFPLPSKPHCLLALHAVFASPSSTQSSSTF